MQVTASGGALGDAQHRATFGECPFGRVLTPAPEDCYGCSLVSLQVELERVGGKDVDGDCGSGHQARGKLLWCWHDMREGIVVHEGDFDSRGGDHVCRRHLPLLGQGRHFQCALASPPKLREQAVMLQLRLDLLEDPRGQEDVDHVAQWHPGEATHRGYRDAGGAWGFVSRRGVALREDGQELWRGTCTNQTRGRSEFVC